MVGCLIELPVKNLLSQESQRHHKGLNCFAPNIAMMTFLAGFLIQCLCSLQPELLPHTMLPSPPLSYPMPTKAPLHQRWSSYIFPLHWINSRFR